MQNMCEHTEWVAHKVKKGCQMWKEEGETEIMVEEKKKKKKPTTPAVPRRSPIQVLSRLNTA